MSCIITVVLEFEISETLTHRVRCCATVSKGDFVETFFARGKHASVDMAREQARTKVMKQVMSSNILTHSMMNNSNFSVNIVTQNNRSRPNPAAIPIFQGFPISVGVSSEPTLRRPQRRGTATRREKPIIPRGRNVLGHTHPLIVDDDDEEVSSFPVFQGQFPQSQGRVIGQGPHIISEVPMTEEEVALLMNEFAKAVAECESSIHPPEHSGLIHQTLSSPDEIRVRKERFGITSRNEQEITSRNERQAAREARFASLDEREAYHQARQAHNAHQRFIKDCVANQSVSQSDPGVEMLLGLSLADLQSLDQAAKDWMYEANEDDEAGEHPPRRKLSPEEKARLDRELDEYMRQDQKYHVDNVD
jgi:hypothetical protein